MARYVLNSPRLTAFGTWRYEGPLDLAAARDFVDRAPFASAVGHESTARVMSRLLGIDIACRRVTVAMQQGDQALVLHLAERPPEGVVLGEGELDALPLAFGRLVRLA